MGSVLPDIQAGGQVERSSIDDGQDFFTYQPEDFDVIVSKPPYTQKTVRKAVRTGKAVRGIAAA